MEFRNAYERKVHKGFETTGESRTQQHFKDEVDVNNVIARYTQTGVVDSQLVHQAQGVYGDFSEVGDFTELQNKIVNAQASFQALPSAVRDRFHNNPAELIAFVRDKSNYNEAVKLGLIDRKRNSVETSPQVVETSVDKSES